MSPASVSAVRDEVISKNKYLLFAGLGHLLFNLEKVLHE
jgi:hypothetical protein